MILLHVGKLHTGGKHLGSKRIFTCPTTGAIDSNRDANYGNGKGFVVGGMVQDKASSQRL